MSGKTEKIGAVAVVGAGIAGVQSALDLAEMGFLVYLIEKTPAIGGIMSMLDKTFPTNDCSMCILSPKLVDCSRNQNIRILTNSEVTGIKGKAGNFSVSIYKKPRYIDIDKCTSCGDCAEACPISIPNEFEQRLSERAPIFKHYPQAIPNAYVIDKTVYSKKKRCIDCMKCVKVCKAEAINHEEKPEDIDLKVGAVILAMGAQPFDPSVKKEFGYSVYKNVVTSLEYERILSASGPYEGKILRPGDGKKPKKIAWIQCVGSRDHTVHNEYCSAMCCMYTAKEAVITKEHEADIEPTVFYIDVRSFGKDFDKYIDRAKKEHGIKYVRSRVSEITEVPQTGDLTIRYEDESGDLHDDTFDMVVLSVGLCMSEGRKKVIDQLGLEMNEFGFAFSHQKDPVALIKPGIFMAGSFLEPQAIPESVMQASAAAASAAALIKEARGTLVTVKETPPQRDVSKEEPRIGVYVCHCGINISAKVDISSVVGYVKTLDNVVYVEDNLYTCSEDTQEKIAEAINTHRLNRIIVAACTPRTHEPLFQKSLADAGLNPYLLEMTNIREHCSWVTEDRDMATQKAKQLIAMTVAKSRLLESIPTMKINMTQKALVIGGGVAGMTSALSLADQGYETTLVEKGETLGGMLNTIHYTVEGINVCELFEKLKSDLQKNPLVTVYTDSKVEKVEGYVGNYKSIISTPDKEVAYEHGVIILAVGSQEYEPTSYEYTTDERILTQADMENRLHGSQAEDIKDGETFVMIQCVESRENERNFCSRVCCMQAIKNALKIKELNPKAEVFILYRDLMTYGFWEKYYKQARETGVMFLQYDPEKKPTVTTGGDIIIKCWENLLQQELSLKADWLILASGMKPNAENEELAKLLKVPTNDDGFFLEAHVKLRPVDFSTRGVFLAGSCHAPKFIGESIYQAQAAAARAATLLAKPDLEAEATIADINTDTCTGCLTCAALCPYTAIDPVTKLINGREISYAVVNEGLCQGCGTCVAACPSGSIDQRGFKDRQIVAMIRAYAPYSSTGGFQ